MFIFNWLGLFVMLIASGIAWLPVDYLENTYSKGIALAYWILATIFFSALGGLFFDRFPERGLWTSYRNGLYQIGYDFFPGSHLPEFVRVDSRRRLLFVIWPLAYGPFLLLLVSSLTWPFDHFNGYGFASTGEHAVYLGMSGLAATFTLILAFLTRRIRKITSLCVCPYCSCEVDDPSLGFCPKCGRVIATKTD